MKHLKLILLGLSLLCIMPLMSRNDYNSNEVSLFGGVGYNTLLYSVESGQTTSYIGGNVGLGYLYLFNENWGLQTGVEAAYYNSTLMMPNFTCVTQGLDDSEGHPFDLYTTVNGYKEAQKMWIMSIPIMAVYQVGRYNKFFAMAGVKVGLPMGNYNSSGTFVNKGYFPEKDNWAIDQAFMGFGSYEDVKNSGKIEYNVCLQVAIEAGVKWYTGTNWSIYSGIYGEYGVNNLVSQKDKKNFIAYDVLKDTKFTNGSSFTTEYMNTNGKLTKFTEQIHPLAVGVKIRVSFGW